MAAWLWIIASGAGLIAVSFFYTRFKVLILEHPFQTVVTSGLAGLILLVLAYLMFRSGLSTMKRRKEVHYANAIGEIAIALSAIEDALSRLLDDADVVRAHEVIISDAPNEKRLRVTARLHMWEVSDLPSRVADIQQDLKRRFEEIMPDAESPEYNVKLLSVVPRRDRRKKEDDTPDDIPKREDNTDETDYFTGLKYPIDSDEDEES
jgi:hypothetical protein